MSNRFAVRSGVVRPSPHGAVVRSPALALRPNRRQVANADVPNAAANGLSWQDGGSGSNGGRDLLADRLRLVPRAGPAGQHGGAEGRAGPRPGAATARVVPTAPPGADGPAVDRGSTAEGHPSPGAFAASLLHRVALLAATLHDAASQAPDLASHGWQRLIDAYVEAIDPLYEIVRRGSTPLPGKESALASLELLDKRLYTMQQLIDASTDSTPTKRTATLGALGRQVGREAAALADRIARDPAFSVPRIDASVHADFPTLGGALRDRVGRIDPFERVGRAVAPSPDRRDRPVLTASGLDALRVGLDTRADRPSPVVAGHAVAAAMDECDRSLDGALLDRARSAAERVRRTPVVREPQAARRATAFRLESAIRTAAFQSDAALLQIAERAIDSMRAWRPQAS